MRSATKSLRFPLGGLAKHGSYRDTTYPTEESVYYTPAAKNVIGECAFASRLRGGSRPGLTLVTGGITGTTEAQWLWPNGDVIQWPTGEDMTYADPLGDYELPNGGGYVIAEHPASAVYRNRLVKSEEAVWMASRTGDFGDFDFGGESGDVTRAVAGNLAYAGRKGDAITAMAAFGDSRLYIATRRMLAVVAGEPTSGQTILSDSVGIVSADAWCNANGVLYFVGPNGLYAVGEGAPMLVSQQLPDDLRGLASALLVYDPHYVGIHIFTASADYFYDITNKAFWPVEYSATKKPDAGWLGVVNNTNRAVFHCADGNWRYWNDAQTTDDGTAIASSVTIGPFKCGVGDDGDGMLDALDMTMAAGSSNVTVSIATAKSAEAAVSATASAITFTAAAGWNPKVRPRIRGAWAVIRLSATGRWAYEAIQATIKSLGGLRV